MLSFKKRRVPLARVFLSTLLLSGYLNNCALAEVDTVTQRFVFQSDTQYPRSPSGADYPGESLPLLDAQNAAITAYRDAYGGGIPIILNGDVTEFGHRYQWNIMKGRMLPGTYYGLGNHDYENNVDSCALNECAMLSVVTHLTEDIKRWDVDAFDQYQEGDDSPTWQKYHGSMAYRKTFGDFAFIQLHNHFAYKKSFSGWFNYEDKTVHINPSLDWLESQLKIADQAGKLIIINMHRHPEDNDWGSAAERARFQELVNKYKVLAIFMGHTHELALRGKIGDVPVLDSGSPIYKTFLVGEADPLANAFTVKQAKDNTLLPTPLLTIPIKFYIPEPSILPWPASLDFTLPLVHVRERDFSHFEVSIDGQPYVRSDNRKKVTIENLTPYTRYNYRIRVYDSGSTTPVKTYDGTATTLNALLSPKDVCYVNLGEPGAPNNSFHVKWSPPYPNYAPGNYWFRVALYTLQGNFISELRGAAQGSRTREILFPEPANFMNARIHVRYQSAGLVDGQDATLDLKDMFHGCGI
jgi:hypothetical protein